MKVALTGGGTLGHVIPTLSVASAIKRADSSASFFYIGSVKENEKKTVEREGIFYYRIKTGKLRRYFSFENFIDLFRLLHGFISALIILKKEKPDVLFSKGGYVSVPVVLAAHLLKIPAVTHESDFSLGLANKINAKFCDFVCLGFNLNKGGKYIFTGNPIREAFKEVKVDKNIKPFILILGGSQGAKSLNEMVYRNLDELLKIGSVYHQAGKTGDFSLVREGYKQVEFISDELPFLIKNASLIISRAGANAITEFLSVGALIVLVPLSTNQSRGDQVENASYLEKEGGALVVRSEGEFILKVKEALLKKDELKKRSKELFVDNAADAIAKVVLQSVGEK